MKQLQWFERNPIVDKLAPHAAELDLRIRRGWMSARKRSLPHDSAVTIANLAVDEIVRELEDLARQVADPEVFGVAQVGRTTHFIVDRYIILRVKKMKSDGRTSNYRTRRQAQYRRQERIPGFPEHVRLDIGYVEDRLGIALADVLVACTNRASGVAWCESIASMAGRVVPLPRETGHTAARKRRIKLPEQRKKRRGNNGGDDDQS